MTPFEKIVIAGLKEDRSTLKGWVTPHFDFFFMPTWGALSGGPYCRDSWSYEFERGWQVPFGKMSDDFLQVPTLIPFLTGDSSTKVSGLSSEENLEFILRMRIEHYFHLKRVHKQDEAQTALDGIKKLLSEAVFVTNEKVEGQKKAGMYELPKYLANPIFIKMLYQTEDSALIDAFMKYLPAPKSHVFKGEEQIPNFILEGSKAVQTFVEKNKANKNTEKAILTLQRNFRGKKRAKENVQRVMDRYHLDEPAAKSMVNEANRPYRPKQCDPNLSIAIYDASKQVKLFDNVTHYTDPKAIKSIFDDGLYGRKTLVNSYLTFNPASLASVDIENGDFNAICMAANQVDAKSKKGLELCFDADKLAKNNACVFYKQKDLALFHNAPTQCVSIGEYTFYFSVTEPLESSGLGTRFALYSNDKKTHPSYSFGEWSKKPLAVVHVPHDFLISHDAKRMHQILTLNFFRFVDALPAVESEKIYSALKGLTKEQLAKVLEEIGKKMITMMEFNFYGAYQVDFDALVSITDCDDYRATPLVKETVNLKALIQELNENKRSLFDKAKKVIPQLLTSYRFLDYLLTQVNPNSKMYPEIRGLRATCVAPLYLNEKNILDDAINQRDIALIFKGASLDLIQHKGLAYFIDRLKGIKPTAYHAIFTDQFHEGLSHYVEKTINHQGISLLQLYDLVLMMASNEVMIKMNLSPASVLMLDFFHSVPKKTMLKEGAIVLSCFVNQANLEYLLNEIHLDYWPALLEQLGLTHEANLDFKELDKKAPTMFHAYPSVGNKVPSFISQLKSLPDNPNPKQVKTLFAHHFAELYRKQGVARPSASDPVGNLIVKTFKAD